MAWVEAVEAPPPMPFWDKRYASELVSPTGGAWGCCTLPEGTGVGEGEMEVETGTAGAELEESVVSCSIFTGWETTGRPPPPPVDGARLVDKLLNGSSFSVPPARKMKQI